MWCRARPRRKMPVPNPHDGELEATASSSLLAFPPDSSDYASYHDIQDTEFVTLTNPEVVMSPHLQRAASSSRLTWDIYSTEWRGQDSASVSLKSASSCYDLSLPPVYVLRRQYTKRRQGQVNRPTDDEPLPSHPTRCGINQVFFFLSSLFSPSAALFAGGVSESPGKSAPALVDAMRQ